MGTGWAGPGWAEVPLWGGVPGLAHGPPSVPQTQPVPNPVAYFLHRSPWWVHRFETLSNHFLELVVPFFIFLGRQMCALHGALQILFQVSPRQGVTVAVSSRSESLGEDGADGPGHTPPSHLEDASRGSGRFQGFPLTG